MLSIHMNLPGPGKRPPLGHLLETKGNLRKLTAGSWNRQQQRKVFRCEEPARPQVSLPGQAVFSPHVVLNGLGLGP